MNSEVSVCTRESGASPALSLGCGHSLTTDNPVDADFVSTEGIHASLHNGVNTNCPGDFALSRECESDYMSVNRSRRSGTDNGSVSYVHMFDRYTHA